jgi:gluconolactonase
MHSYAQTNLQLFNQLRTDGYSSPDLDLVYDAYQLAMSLFSGRFQPSGKPFIAHVVGTASILASLRLPGAVVASGLLHNVYEHGDFGTARRNASGVKRRNIKRLLGSELEDYVAKFPLFGWKSATAQLALSDPSRLGVVDRHVLSLRLADYLEHLLDLDLLYYGSSARRYYMGNATVAIALADAFELRALAAEIKEAIRQTNSTELPVNLPAGKIRDGSFVIAPRSCRKRFFITLGENLVHITHQSHFTGRKALRVLYRKSIGIAKTVLAIYQLAAIACRAKAICLSDCLESHSAEFIQLFPEDAVLERVATGFEFTEGPVWIEDEQSLLFSDIPANRIYRLGADRRVTIFRSPSANSNGLTRDRYRRLIACQHGNRRVSRTEADGSIVTLADRFEGKKLNSPNDVVVKSDGAIYFTDPPYGIKLHEQEQRVQGVYRLSPATGEVALVADDFIRPNGLAFSHDEKKLYVDDSERRHIRVFNVNDDGSLSGGTVFHEMNSGLSGSPDGMKVDVEGRVYCTGAGGVWVFDREGIHLGTIVTPEKPSNCAWGGSDWRTLYITACRSVYAIRVQTSGITPLTTP